MTLSNSSGFNFLSPEEAVALMPTAFTEAREAREDVEREEEWRRIRRGRFTSSKMHSFFTTKLSPSYAKTAETYIRGRLAQRMGMKLPRAHSHSMTWGQKYEVESMKFLMDMTGYEVTKYGRDQEFILRGDYEGSTPDGIIKDFRMSVEGKCPFRPEVHTKFLEMQTVEDLIAINYEYYIQVQHQIEICEMDSGLFFSYHPQPEDGEEKLAYLIVPRNQEFIDVMNKRTEEAITQLKEIRSRIEAAKKQRWPKD